ncbi:MAG: pal [Gammaproteobacteria bacterium]|nr:pal [Gammaproteobacteria bacterium]
MQLKHFKYTLLISSILALSACSAPGHKGQDEAAAAADAISGAQTSGVGDSSNFGDQAGGPGQSLAKRTYYFDYDNSQIHDQDKPAISANADYLIAHATARIILEGHTDPRGSREYNVALGERRANAVADFMKEKGVSPEQIRVVSYGAQRLAAPGRTESDYRLDRRVVLVYSKK